MSKPDRLFMQYPVTSLFEMWSINDDSLCNRQQMEITDVAVNVPLSENFKFMLILRSIIVIATCKSTQHEPEEFRNLPCIHLRLKYVR